MQTIRRGLYLEKRSSGPDVTALGAFLRDALEIRPSPLTSQTRRTILWPDTPSPWGEGSESKAREANVRDPKLKLDLLNRLKSVEGHIRGIQRMVEEDQYCIDILNQTGAIHKALEKIDVMILENHLEGCVTTAIRGDDPGERERVLRELLLLFQGGPTSQRGRHLQAPTLEALAGGESDGGKCCD